MGCGNLIDACHRLAKRPNGCLAPRAVGGGHVGQQEDVLALGHTTLRTEESGLDHGLPVFDVRLRGSCHGPGDPIRNRCYLRMLPLGVHGKPVDDIFVFQYGVHDSLAGVIVIVGDEDYLVPYVGQNLILEGLVVPAMNEYDVPIPE